MRWHDSRRPIAAAGISLLFLLFFQQTLFTNLLLDGYDIVQAFFHYREFVRQSLLNGVIPLWNPYIFCGYPSLAALQSSSLHPLTFIFLWAPTWLHINLSLYCYAFISCLGMYLYLTQLGAGFWPAMFAGITYTYNLFNLRHLKAGHLTHICTVMALPLVFALWERYRSNSSHRILLTAGVFFATILLLGHPQFFYILILGLALYQIMQRLWRHHGESSTTLVRAITFNGCGLVIAVTLSAAQIIPAFEFMGSINRSGISTFEFLTDSSVPFLNLLSYMAPNLLGDGIQTPYWGEWYLWEVTGYLSVPTLILACSALAVKKLRDRKVAVWFATAVLALFIVLGRYTPVYAVILKVLPGLSLFRNPGRFLFIINFLLCACAGWSLHRIVIELDKRSRALYSIVLLILGLGLSGALIWANSNPPPDSWKNLVSRTLTDGEHPFPVEIQDLNQFHKLTFDDVRDDVRDASLLILLLALMILASIRRPKLGQAMLCFAVAGDLLVRGYPYLSGVDASRIVWPQKVSAFLKSNVGSGRILPLLSQADLNVPMSLRIRAPGGYDSTCSSRFNDLILLINGEALGTILTSVQPYRFGSLWSLLAIKYLVLPPNIAIGALSFPLVFSDGDFRIYQNPHPLPRHYLAGATHIAGSRRAVWESLNSAGFDPFALTVVEDGDVDIARASSGEITPIQPEEDTPHRIILKVQCNYRRLMVTTDSWDRGWKAQVDGESASIAPVNLGFRGVWLEAGEHLVEFRYEPVSYRLGLFVSLISISLLTMGLTFPLFMTRSRKSNQRNRIR